MASILDLAAIISERTSVAERIAWLQGKGLIARMKSCPTCSQAMDLQSRSDVSDKYRCIVTGIIALEMSKISNHYFCIKGGGAQSLIAASLLACVMGRFLRSLSFPSDSGSSSCIGGYASTQSLMLHRRLRCRRKVLSRCTNT